MRTVAELALLGQRLDVGEAAVGQVFLAGRLEFAHAGRVDQAGAGRQRDEGTERGGVATARVAFAHFAGLHPLVAEQGVGQRGLARARRPHQHHGVARLQPRRQLRDALRILGVDGEHRHALRGEVGQYLDRVVGVLGAVGLGQHDDRLRTATTDQQQVALDAARIEVGIQAADDEHRIDVRGDHLLVVMLAGRAALDAGMARQQRHDARALGGGILQQHPVADGRAFMGREPGALPFGKRFGLHAHAGGVRHDIARAVLLDHACRGGARVGLHDGPPRAVLRFPRIRPADRSQQGDVGHTGDGGFGHGAHSRRPLKPAGPDGPNIR